MSELTLHSRNSNEYVGVRTLGYKKYVANIHIRDCTVCLGTFETAEEAAHAYDEAALKYIGPGADLNRVPVE